MTNDVTVLSYKHPGGLWDKTLAEGELKTPKQHIFYGTRHCSTFRIQGVLFNNIKFLFLTFIWQRDTGLYGNHKPFICDEKDKSGQFM